MNFTSAELSEAQFQTVSRMVYRLCGINLKDGKQALVRARLMKRLRALNMKSFEEYLNHIGTDSGLPELNFMIDVITTNKTSFFREPEHFQFLADKVLSEIGHSKKLRFWTAACSSGEEAFSLAIVLRECFGDIDARDIKILATDISLRMLEKARKAVYNGKDTLQDVDNHLLQKYFAKVSDGDFPEYQIRDIVRNMVKIARLNLMDAWPMKGLFHVIFCRNVMIYFDRATQQRLVSRFWDFLEPGGYLFVGHSEGLSAISHRFRYIRPAVYRK
jgi:chemotaxis protein methyltransferase CheR